MKNVKGTKVANDRGAALIQVAFGLLAMMAFSTFVMDYGVFWISRRQAQNSADAGAMAGAVALSYDDPADSSGVVAQSAQAEALRNPVWGQSPSVVSATDIHTPATGFSCPDATSTCVKVDVYRSSARSNALPIFFGTFASLTSQDVQATATAKVGTANASNCLMPWAVLDVDAAGFAYNVADDYGSEVTLKVGAGANTGGWFQATGIGGNGAGPNGYEGAIEGCINVEYGVGDTLPIKNGNMSGPTNKGVDYITSQDPGAYFCGPATSCTPPSSCGNAKGCIEGSICNGTVTAACPYGLSPRIVAVPTINEAIWQANNNTLQVDNIFGFFLIGDNGNGNNSTVTGILINQAGLVDGGKGTVSPSNAFLKSIYLVR